MWFLKGEKVVVNSIEHQKNSLSNCYFEKIIFAPLFSWKYPCTIIKNSWSVFSGKIIMTYYLQLCSEVQNYKMDISVKHFMVYFYAQRFFLFRRNKKATIIRISPVLVFVYIHDSFLCYCKRCYCPKIYTVKPRI